jgi:hypothetical protein
MGESDSINLSVTTHSVAYFFLDEITAAFTIESYHASIHCVLEKSSGGGLYDGYSSQKCPLQGQLKLLQRTLTTKSMPGLCQEA